MSSQTVFRLTPQNGFEALQAFQEPIPTVGKQEVLVKIRSVALNYRDIVIATAKYPVPVKDNVIPCSDMAGEVAQVSDGVTVLSVGDRVLAPVDPDFLYGPSKGAGGAFGGGRDGVLTAFTQWAALVGTGSTVWNAFYGNKPLKPGDTVLILGTGGVSLTALIFAKAAGATTIFTSSSDQKLAHVKARYGADHTINYATHADWAAEVQRITGGRGADHIIENGGAGTMRQSLQAVAYGGVVSAIGFLSTVTQDQMPDVTMMTMLKGCVTRGILSGSKQQLEEAVRFAQGRGLEVPVDKTFGYNRDEIIAALQYVADGRHIGKVCIDLD
ncbi:Uu.00g011340.m01.CDS01 [Anthostomella pinea]|uniref:Uu.00g011340.m01.CDS01 n=1 Tax=Anthostomella pinea TaxID=933095 RepID=A0AAI8VYC8_9PEZI|nr:Uu.00g011340.m01.CDS01 [Anthostomella pinea]